MDELLLKKKKFAEKFTKATKQLKEVILEANVENPRKHVVGYYDKAIKFDKECELKKERNQYMFF